MGNTVGINGFGRIGRLFLRSVIEQGWPVEIRGINSRAETKTLAHLLKYDSTHGLLPTEVEYTNESLLIDGKEISIYRYSNPKDIPWDSEASIVVEATGQISTRAQAATHLHKGIRKVIVAAPMKNPDLTVIMGVNQDQYDPGKHHIVSNASCTSNCLIPLCYVIDDKFGIKNGSFSTIHSVTLSQRMLDGSHKDLRRARSALNSIIPTTTGAASVIEQVLPHLSGKLHGLAYRVPVINVSLLDLVVQLETSTNLEGLHQVFKTAAEGRFKNIIDLEYQPLVSTDFISNPNSAIIDVNLTQELASDRYRVTSWYDNEYGYARRITDLTKVIQNSL